MWWWNLTNWLTLWCHWPTTPSASPLQQRNPPPTPWCRHHSATLQWLVRSTSTPSPHVGRATAAVQLWSSPATWTSVCIRAHSPPFLQHTASQHRPSPPSHQLLGGGGGCSGDTCVTQACSVYPAVCFNGSLFLYTPDRCVLVAWMRACVRALDRAREQLIVPGMSALLLLCNQYRSLRDSVLLRQSSRRYCVLHCPGLWHWQTCILMALRQL